MTNTITGYFDIKTLIFYLFLSFFSAYSLKKVKDKEATKEKKQSIFTNNYVLWFLLWTIIATFRYVSYGIGGSDAITYINFFNIANSSNIPAYYMHYEILFREIVGFLRFLSSDYHFFFFIIYGFICWAYIFFLNEFCPKVGSKIPYLILFFPFLITFNTIRTGLAIAINLVAMVLIFRKKELFGFLLMISTFFIHHASIIFICSFLYYKLFKNNKINKYNYIAIFILSIVVGKLAQMFFLNYLTSFFDGAYSLYAQKSMSSGFFVDYWKPIFGELLLFAVVLLLYVPINKHIYSLKDDNDRNRLLFVFCFCLYDFLTIPISYYLGVWRAYEYTYLFRLIMWGEIIYILKKNSSFFSRKILNVFFVCCFSGWMIFRIYCTWEMSSSMPYIFELFMR